MDASGVARNRPVPPTSLPISRPLGSKSSPRDENWNALIIRKLFGLTLYVTSL